MATDGASRVCPECSKPLAPGQAFCASCGAPLSPPISTQMGRNLPPDSWDTVAEADDRARNHPLAMSRTRTGLLLAIIGFALAWIPFAGGVGGLILLIGVVFLWLGRGGFGADHHRNVTAGGVCILLALLLGIGVGVWFASSLVSAAGAAGATPASVGATLTSDLGTLLEVSVATTALISVGYLLLPYALADATTRALLGGALVLSILFAVAIFLVLGPQISSAVAQSTAGSTINLGPVQAIQTRSALWGAAQIVPDSLFAFAYYRVRSSPAVGSAALAPPPPGSEPYGRTR